MSKRDRKSVFLLHFIFNPMEVDLPDGFDDVLIGLNIWPKHIAGIEQKKAIMNQQEFTIHGTTFYRNPPNRKESGTLTFRYAQGNKTRVTKEEYD